MTTLSPYPIRHRTAAVVFLSLLSMLGCFMWFGRLNENVPSTNKSIEFEDRIIDRIVDLPEKKAKDSATPPLYLFQSDQYADDDEPEATTLEEEGERIRSIDSPRESVQPSDTSAATEKSTEAKNQIIDGIVDLPEKKVKDSATPPPYLFQSEQYADDDEPEATALEEEGERIRSIDTPRENAQFSDASAAKSLDFSLPVASDSATTSKQIDYTDRPKLVWLMSYPNSGTSYTMTMVARATQRATASNYGKEVTRPGSYSTPLYPGHWNGPFYEPKENRKLPRDYVLVKTHCGSRCVQCSPDEYVTNQIEFEKECRRGSANLPPLGHRGLKDSNSTSATSSSLDMSASADDGYQIVHYDIEVPKAIHLYRSVFDNVVSRFHLERKHWVASKKKRYYERYTNDPAGFRRWCRDMNKQYGPSPGGPPQHVLDDDIVEIMQGVPCHGEVFKYTQWHNLANAITTQNMRSALVIHYENYEKNWNATASRILDFLHLEMEGTKKPFGSKNYDAYFTTEERNATRVLVERLATEPVWKQVKRYFD